MTSNATEKRGRLRGFTLIELLIVIAIIAILALIAIPNFIEAQTRSKVARVQSDMRSVATALEAYFVDYNAYADVDHRPGQLHQLLQYRGYLWRERAPDPDLGAAQPFWLTTPVAYLGGRPPVDVFTADEEAVSGHVYRNHSFFYYNFVSAAGDLEFLANATDAPVRAPAPMRFNEGARNHVAYDDGRLWQAHWAIMSPGPERGKRLETGSWPRRFMDDDRGWSDFMVKGWTSTYDPTNGTISDGAIWRLSCGSP